MGPRGVMGLGVMGRGLRDPVELRGCELRGGVYGTLWSYGAESYGEGSVGPHRVMGLIVKGRGLWDPWSYGAEVVGRGLWDPMEFGVIVLYGRGAQFWDLRGLGLCVMGGDTRAQDPPTHTVLLGGGEGWGG